MASWQLQDAKARFSEFLDAALEKGPQVVTRRGVETAVLIPIDDWRRLQRAARPGLKELLMEANPPIEEFEMDRGGLRRRTLVEFK
jgi:antitoxin Phd